MPVGRENYATTELYFYSSFKDNEKRDGVQQTLFSEPKQTLNDISFSCRAIDVERHILLRMVHIRGIIIGRMEDCRVTVVITGDSETSTNPVGKAARTAWNVQRHHKHAKRLRYEQPRLVRRRACLHEKRQVRKLLHICTIYANTVLEVTSTFSMVGTQYDIVL